MYYEVLGIKQDAGQSEVKKAYYKLAREIHPDKVTEEQKEEANKKFHLLNKAYEILFDADKRRNYDTYGESSLKEDFVPPPKKEFAEISAKVLYTNPKNHSIFHIFAENANKKFRCIYEGFLPIRKGDAVMGIAEYMIYRNEETLTFQAAPFVVIGTDKETILEGIAAAWRGSGYTRKKAENIYSTLNSKGDVMKEINSIALHYNYENLSYDPYTIYSLICDQKQFHKLSVYWYKSFVLRNLYLLGLNNKEIQHSKINPVELYEKCMENPYMVTSLSLEKCDTIIAKCGKTVNIKMRECGKIVRKIADMMEGKGWTGIPSQMLLRMFPHLLEYMDMLKDEFGIVCDMHTVYLNYAYEVETSIADWVKELINSSCILNIGEITYTRNDISEDQKNAVTTALTNNISIITGPGGTGKTHTIKEIVYNLKRNGISYCIASFTGKAVSRIREVVNESEPATMHMMISKAKEKKENFKCLILDEASMITIDLLYEFKKCFSHDFAIVFVGDVNQLEPIGWGSIFDSLIQSNIVPKTVLKTIHRTNNTAENGILINSRRIINHKDPDYEGEEFDFSLTGNFKIIPGDLTTVKNMIEVLKNSSIPASKLVVISPYNKDLEVINKTCSEMYNGINRNVTDFRGRIWRVADRVMITENNYKNGLMNGTEGKIIDVNEDLVTVQLACGTFSFATCKVLDEEDNKDLNTKSLILSYAVSVHKMQGNEIDYVIGYIPQGSPSSTFMNCNLLYTLITRTKKAIWLIGDIETMIRSATTKPSWRCSNLTKRLLPSSE